MALVQFPNQDQSAFEEVDDRRERARVNDHESEIARISKSRNTGQQGNQGTKGTWERAVRMSTARRTSRPAATRISKLIGRSKVYRNGQTKEAVLSQSPRHKTKRFREQDQDVGVLGQDHKIRGPEQLAVGAQGPRAAVL